MQAMIPTTTALAGTGRAAGSSNGEFKSGPLKEWKTSYSVKLFVS